MVESHLREGQHRQRKRSRRASWRRRGHARRDGAVQNWYNTRYIHSLDRSVETPPSRCTTAVQAHPLATRPQTQPRNSKVGEQRRIPSSFTGQTSKEKSTHTRGRKKETGKTEKKQHHQNQNHQNTIPKVCLSAESTVLNCKANDVSNTSN